MVLKQTRVKNTSEQQKETRFLMAAVLLVMLGFAARLLRLDAAPLYLDEATQIWWAQRIITHGEWLQGAVFNKALYPIMAAVFYPMGPEAPFLGRIAVVFNGVISTAVCIALGRTLDRKRTGLLAGLLYALIGLAVFHERQALSDPLVGMLTAFSTLVIVKLARKPRLWLGVMLGVTLGLGFVAKLSVLPFFAMPFVGIVLLSKGWKDAFRALLWSLLGLAIAAGIAQLSLELAEMTGFAPEVNNMGDSRIRLFALNSPDVRADIGRDVGNFVDFMSLYVGWPALAIAVAAIAGVFARDRWREVLFIWVPAVGITVAWLFVKTEAFTLPARYFMTTPVPLAVLIAMAIRLGTDALRGRWPKLAPWVGGIAIGLAVLPSLWFDAALIRDFDTAPLARGDQDLYREGLTAGYAYKALAQDLLAEWENGDGQPLDTMTLGGFYWQVSVHLGPRTGTHMWLNPRHPFQHLELAQFLARDETVYVIENTHFESLPDENPLGAVLEHTRTYEHEAVTLKLFKVMGAEGELAAEIYEARVPTVEKLAEEYDGLVAQAAALPPEVPVLVFPAGQAEALTQRGVANVQPVTLTRWPLTDEVAEEALDQFDLGTDGEQVAVVQADPYASDPDHQLTLALRDRMYFLNEIWVSPLSLTTYVTGPDDIVYDPVGAVWEDAITLAELAIVDQSAAPGGPVRLALAWQTAVEVQDSFTVFVHIIDENDSLVGQYDSIPGGGFLPMTGWTPGETITDRFAIMLPEEASPGEYRIRVGIYRSDNFLRLQVTDGTDTGPDYAIVGHFNVVGEG